jgi:hypothetical protein
MIWNRVGQWAHQSECGTYLISASMIDKRQYGYTAWIAGRNPRSLIATLDFTEAKRACEAHQRGTMPLDGETDELNFGSQEPQR